MKIIQSAKRSALLVFGAVVFLTCLSATQTKAQAVWVVCTWDTSSIYKQKDGKEKFERRGDTIKGNGYPQYDFLVISNGPNKGEGTSFPFCAATCSGERARVTAREMIKNQ